MIQLTFSMSFCIRTGRTVVPLKPCLWCGKFHGFPRSSGSWCWSCIACTESAFVHSYALSRCANVTEALIGPRNCILGSKWMPYSEEQTFTNIFDFVIYSATQIKVSTFYEPMLKTLHIWEQFKLIKQVFTFRDGESRWQQDYWLYLAK